MSRALPPSVQPDSDDNMDDALTLARYNEEIEQNIRDLRGETSASPWGLPHNILEPPPSSGTSDGIEDVIASAPLHIRRLTAGPSQSRKDKGRVPPSRTQTPISTGIRQLQSLQAEIRRLEEEKTAALHKVKQLQNQQASTSSFLHQTAASVQNLSSAHTAAQQAISTNNATSIDQLATMINERFDRVDNNINILNHRGETRHNAYMTRMATIEERLTRLEQRPVPQVISPQPISPPTNLQQLTLSAAQMQPPPPPPPDEQQQAPPPPPSPHRALQIDDDMVAGKAPIPGKFSGDRDQLEGWILQMDDYFVVTKIRNQAQQLSFVSMCLSGTALEWWKNKKTSFRTWEEAQDSLRHYYGDHYKPDRCYRQLMELRQTSTVQHYLTEVDRLNSYANIPDRQLINIMINGINHKLREAMAHYEHLRSDPAAWRDRLVKMDITSTEFRTRDRDHGRDRKRNHHGETKLEDRISLRGGATTFTNERPRVPESTIQKRKQEDRCFKCGKKGHLVADCKTGWKVKTPPPFFPRKPDTTNQQPTSNKRQRTDHGHLKITELGSEESGNE